MENLAVRYTFRKGEVHYFVRKVPVRLKDRYRTTRISFSLRTRSSRVAADRANRIAARLDDFWFSLGCGDVPGAHLIVRGQPSEPAPSSVAQASSTVQSTLQENPSPTLSDAAALYLRLKGSGKSDTFKRSIERATEYLREAVGEKTAFAYTRADANAFRDWLLARGMAGSSLKRVIGMLRTMFNCVASELAVDFRNPFAGVIFDATAGVEDRQPIPLPAIRRIQTACHEMDDDLRWLIAIISDSGLRLAEAAGLARSDIVLKHPVPHLKIVPHPWRSLKSASSKRAVPLVGSAKWAAERIMETPSGSPYAFPRYVRDGCTNANSASAALNKWQSSILPAGYTIHGYRHALRDRLRSVSCPSDIVDQIGGWTTPGVEQGYGNGYPLEVMEKWMKAIT